MHKHSIITLGKRTLLWLILLLSPIQTLAISESVQHHVIYDSVYYDEAKICVAPAPVAGGSAEAILNVLRALPIREKIAELFVVGFTDRAKAKEMVAQYQIGGVFLGTGADALFDKGATDEIKAAGKVPALIVTDQEGGRVARLESKIGTYPSAKDMGKMPDGQITASAKEMARKMKDLGITVDFAPVVDIDDGHNSIISRIGRAFSPNPDEVTAKSQAFAKGLREGGVLPVFKHFPGHGRADGDSHKNAVSTPPLTDLRSSDLRPYEPVQNSGPSGVMVGHLIVPDLTNGVQASISKPAIDLLRKDYHFDQVVFSDEIAQMKAITDKYTPAVAVSLAIQAGVDMPIFNHNGQYGDIGNQIDKTITQVEADIKAGKITEEQLNQSLARIATFKAFNQSQNPGTAPGVTPGTPGTPAGGASVLPTGPDPSVRNPFTGPKITPTSVVLHWTAYDYKDPQDLVNVLRSRVEAGYPNGRAVQLTIDRQGVVHQLAESLETRPIQTFIDPNYNNSTIGIEIESSTTSDTKVAANDLMSNTAQYNTVLGVVRELMAKYKIQNVVDVAGRKGILGHYDVPSPGNQDPGTAYMAKVRADLGKAGGSPGPATATGSKIYVLGDSLTDGMTRSGGLEQKLKDKGWEVVKINYKGGEPLKWGVGQLNADQATLAKADTLLVGLGTNNSGNVPYNAVPQAKSEMEQIIAAAKKARPDIKIYWTDFFGKGFYNKVDLPAAYKVLNQTLEDVAKANNVTVIHWSTSSIAAQHVKDNEVHPYSGWKEMAQFVVDGLGGSASAAKPVDGSCVCPTAATSLSGSDNAEKIFTYFVAHGLAPHMAAGIMGNMMAESGMNPRALEPGTTGDAPIRGRGYGLVQWTFVERQKPLEDLATARNLPVSDLGLQLDYVMIELAGSHKSAGDQLRSSTDVDSATMIIEDHYEIHGDPQHQQKRRDWAKGFLAKYGSLAGTAAAATGTAAQLTSSPSCGGASGGLGVSADGFVFPLKTTQSTLINHKPLAWCRQVTTNCHHHYNAADIFAPTGTIIVAAQAGTVVSANFSGQFGQNVSIKGADGTNYYYTHMPQGKNKVKPGDTVTAGQEIGEVGTDANAAGTPSHLHFDMIKGSRPGCSGASCVGLGFIEVQPFLRAAFEKLPQ